ncbi:peptidyl-prolyl cis/trans isomerase [Peziza echinospora]|nr:peptidyl-prolyl cis/trans isomerase [Peziza echinospora]
MVVSAPSPSASQWEPPSDVNHQVLKEYMAANFPKGGPQSQEKIRCAHLLVKHRDSRRPSSWKTAEITRTKEEALEILRGFENRIRAGNATLGDLATSESDCSSARKKGDLGFFGRGDMQREFEEAAYALKVGEMSGPVETGSGVHLIERYTPPCNCFFYPNHGS